MAPSSRLQEYRNVLEGEGGASVAEIRRAYKRMALKWHPDRHHTNKEYASKRFVEVTVAYKALLREAKRREERPTSTRSSHAEKENVREPDTPKPRCSPSLKSWFFGGDARSQNTKRPRKDDNTTSSHSSPNEKTTRSSPRRAHFEPEPSTSHYSQSVPSGSQRSYTHTPR